MTLPYLHELTWDELQAVTKQGKSVIDLDGISSLWTLGSKALFTRWSKDVQTIARSDRFRELRPEVMKDFQDRQITLPEFTKAPPRFTWSFSALQDFENCPLSYAEKRYYKRVKQEEAEAMRDGTLVHKAAEQYAKGEPVEDPDRLPKVKPYVDAIKSSVGDGQLLVEQELALTRGLQPTDWFGPDAWGRGVIDLAVLNGTTARVFDWKTGKLKHDDTQLRVFCAFLAQHHPHLQEFHAKFIWLKEGKVTGLDKPLLRSDLVGVWRDLLTRVTRMEQAWNSQVFQARSSGLCKRHCAVSKCPHCGSK